MIPRQRSIANALEFLSQAAKAMDQAQACLRDAKIETLAAPDGVTFHCDDLFQTGTSETFRSDNYLDANSIVGNIVALFVALRDGGAQ